MAKKGKHLSAATRQKISESVKRAAAERAKASTAKVAPFALADNGGLTSAERASLHAKVIRPPRTSHDEAMQLATDVVGIVGGEVSDLLLVRVVDRILRP